MDESDLSFTDQSLLLDGYFEFHQDWFDGLSDPELADLDSYFGIVSKPDDVLAWRDEHLADDPSLALRATAIANRVLVSVGASGLSTP